MKVWAKHLLAFLVPFITLAFLLTGPHRWYVALAWLLAIPLLRAFDEWGGPARRSPVASPAVDLPAWPFDAVLIVLAALQPVTIVLFARMIAEAGLLSGDAFAAAILVGANSGYSGIVVAHELIHRRSRGMQLLGRMLMISTLYDHFCVEHVRGHHARVGTEDDPATARFGEPFADFLRRTVRGQLKSAFRLEARRLGNEDMRWHDPRVLKSTVLHGVLVEIALAITILAIFGPAAFVVFLAQAYVAIHLLEAVNYFEHWGLQRRGAKVRPIDSWDSASAFTLFSMIGLSRHADHHAHATRPFQSLRLLDESPKLPHGYIAMVLLVLFNDAEARRLMTEELTRRRLGPFAEA